ncbi:hypothetical protein [Aquimarina litoralis]|uniref:hypothetical protein n=1 Tax=Aquimarina litoralis TaxID=584605 RepID=UPI001C57C378|nr:hypothetical protein [Aquimarina litoralis]MBW1298925.1 hypothetical protein [Aquimarina litoralis]
MQKLYVKFSKDWQDHFMMYAALSIIVSTCLGGIAVFTIFQNGSRMLQFAELLMVVTLCTGLLASILTVQKPKIVFHTLLGSLIICSLITIINLLF